MAAAASFQYIQRGLCRVPGMDDHGQARTDGQVQLEFEGTALCRLVLPHAVKIQAAFTDGGQQVPVGRIQGFDSESLQHLQVLLAGWRGGMDAKGEVYSPEGVFPGEIPGPGIARGFY